MLKHELLNLTQTLLNWIKAVAIANANVALSCCCRLKKSPPPHLWGI